MAEKERKEVALESLALSTLGGLLLLLLLLLLLSFAKAKAVGSDRRLFFATEADERVALVVDGIESNSAGSYACLGECEW